MFVRLLGLAGAALLGVTATAEAQSTAGHAGHGGHGGHAAPAAAASQAGQALAHGHAMLTAPSGAPAPAGMVMVHGTTVELTLTGDQTGATRPWRLHKGTCADDQGTVGDASKFAPATIDTDGTGAAKAVLDAPLTEGAPYFVAAHASTSDMKSIVACGPITKGAM